MTNSQYIIAWILYLVGATGHMLALWLITNRLPIRIKRALYMGAAILLYLPWQTRPDMHYLAPALLTAIYDGLGQGQPAMARAGYAVALAFMVTVVLAVCLPASKTATGYNSSKKGPVRNV